MTLEIIERNSRSWRMWAAQSTLKSIGTRYLIATELAASAQPQVDGSPKLPVPWYGMQGCQVTERIVHDFHVYDFVPAKDRSASEPSAKATAPRKKIYFFAGGAFRFQASAMHFMLCAALTSKIPNTSATIISYPLAPKNSAPTAFPATQKVAQTLLAESQDKNETVIYFGDSAGGNLVLSLVLDSLAQDPNALAPSTIFAMSPGVNSEHDNPKCLELAPYDCLLSNEFIHVAAKDWAGSWAKTDSRISPINADISVFAKRGIQVHGLIAGYDVLAPDSERFVQKLKDAGTSGKWLVWDQQMHDFPLGFAAGLPESVEALDWIVKLLS